MHSASSTPISSASSALILGIDASNLRTGGGFNHLPQILEHLNPEMYSIKKIIVWGNQQMLQELPKRSWLIPSYSAELDQSILKRTYWQQRILPQLLEKESCDILFSPGGTSPRRVKIPNIVMSRNMLPFEEKEYSRYPIWSYSRLRLKALKITQTRSMLRAAGVIFLTKYAKSTIETMLSHELKNSAIIPHGVDPRFFLKPRKPVSLNELSSSRPFKFLYVSTVDLYKHQWNVARAAQSVRKKGYPIQVDFMGSAFPRALKNFKDTLEKIDPQKTFLHYHRQMAFKDLHSAYHNADAFIFASTCENLPNILLEAMAAGLPISSANKGPMTDILENAGLTFDSESPDSIAESMIQLIQDPQQRGVLAQRAYEKAQNYSWKRCASETFAFITQSLQKEGN